MIVLVLFLGAAVLFFTGVVFFGWYFSAPVYRGPVSDHFNGKKFLNPGNVEAKGFRDLWKWMRTRERGKWHSRMDQEPGPKPVAIVAGPEIAVTFVNHSTFLIQTRGLNILTDPIWARRASPVSFSGPMRMRPPGIRFDDLPKIDIILLTHNHYDHLDMSALKELWKRYRPVTFCTLGVRQYLNSRGIDRVREMDWWDESVFNDEMKVICTPALHFSGRGMFDRDRTLWSGFALKFSSGSIYYCGDTGYGDFFREIGERLAPIKLAFLPIGAYKPRWFMGPIHTGPDEALKIHEEIGSPLSIGMHYGTFPLADDGEDDPVNELKRLMVERGLQEDTFVVLEEGIVFSRDDI